MIVSPVLVFAALIVLYLFSAIRVLREYERGVVFRLGKLLPQPKGPGIVLVFARADRLRGRRQGKRHLEERLRPSRPHALAQLVGFFERVADGAQLGDLPHGGARGSAPHPLVVMKRDRRERDLRRRGAGGGPDRRGREPQSPSQGLRNLPRSPARAVFRTGARRRRRQRGR